MSMKLNPELKEGDEVVLIYMSDESGMRPGLSGVVENVSNTMWGPQYQIKWENGSRLDLLPDADKWVLKSEFKKKSDVNESLDNESKNIIDNKVFLKYVKDNRTVFKFLSLLQDSGLTNMIGARPFLTYTSDNLYDYIKGQFKDPEDYRELIDIADESRNAIIRGLMDMYDDTYQSLGDMSKVNMDFDKLTKQAMSLYLNNYGVVIKK